MPHILIVDDSSFARANLRRPLEEAGFTTSEAASGQAALELAPAAHPDVITLDLLMPGLSGLETLVGLKPLCPAARYVIISADIQNATRQEMISAGAHAFLNKPVARAELVDTIRALLEKPQ